MGQNDILLAGLVGAAAIVAYASVASFRAWADSVLKGVIPGNVSASCDQLCANGACATYGQYCKGTCAKCQVAVDRQNACQSTCNAKKMLPSFNSSGSCVCVPPGTTTPGKPRPTPLGKVYPHPYLPGVSCWRNKCGAKEVSWCTKGNAAQVLAAWKANACKTAARAYSYAGFDNVTIA